MVWPTLHYADAPAAIRWLCDTFGFIEVLVVDGQDPGVVEHSQLAWPEGGGVMAGNGRTGRQRVLPAGHRSGLHAMWSPTGRTSCSSGPTAAGAEVVRGLFDEDYGSRGFSVRDPEGNIWSFGTYRGEPIPT